MNFRRKYRPEVPGFQIAPMIDVVFLLLCFFVTSQIFAQWESEIDITLPMSKKGQIPDRLPGEIIINIMKDGTFIVNKQVLDENGLLGLMGEIVKYFPDQPVLIRADKTTQYENIIRALDLCRQANIWNVSFATSLHDTSQKSGT